MCTLTRRGTLQNTSVHAPRTVQLCVARPRSACARGVSCERVHGCNQRRTWCMGERPDGSIHAQRHGLNCTQACALLHASCMHARMCTRACVRARMHVTPPSVECAKLAEYGTSRRRVLMSDVVTRVRTDAHAWSATPIGTTECPCIALQRLHASECRVSRTYLTRLCWCKNVSTHLSKDLHRQHSNGQC
jgi:hypothetical protein